MMFSKECNIFFICLCATLITTSTIAQKQSWQIQPVNIQTKWADKVSINLVLPEYPRPQMRRKQWINLNGLWNYTTTLKDAAVPQSFDKTILVPFPIESALSGVKKQLLPEELLWYQRSITKPDIKPDEKVLLHFGAVDYEATVFINGKEVGQHVGGYQHFTIDITNALSKKENILVVKVWDPSDAGPNPHGKQVLNPEGIMYTPSSGVWQTAWMEIVPTVFIESLKITPNIDKGIASVKVMLGNGSSSNITTNTQNSNFDVSSFEVEITSKIGNIVTGSVKGKANTNLTLFVKNAHLWSPDDPFLYDLDIKLLKNGKPMDRVKSYLGMRKIDIQKDKNGVDRIFLNNQYTYNLGTLDQGFWPDGLYTAPTDEALRFDIEASKAMGFNTIRKHIKIEPDRWYYYTDKLGMLVWQDMVNPGNDSNEGHSQFEKENKENIAQLYNHPSIITWVLFNEKWGQYDQERLTKWFKNEDTSRLINGHSGEMLYVNDQLRSPSPNAWVAADMTDVHSYPFPRNAPVEPGKVRVVGEFGGIGVPIEGHLWNDLVAGWGYDGVVKPPAMQKLYTQMVDSLKVLEREGLSASIYTQPFDVEAEQNGLMTYDRAIIKLPSTVIRDIHARLWPITKNYSLATQNFIPSVADSINKSYAARLDEYKKGRGDSAFLRLLVIMAKKNNDPKIVSQAISTYITGIKDQFLEANLKFIQQYTNSTKDTGFSIFFNNIKKVNHVLGKDEAEAKITALIEKDEILPLIKKGEKPNWDAIEKNVVGKYGDIGQEITWQTIVLYSANHQEWNSFSHFLKPWFEKYGYKRKWVTPSLINGLAWLTFENIDDKDALGAACIMTSHGLRTDEQPTPNLLDTHANLLYKLGKKNEALHWEEKAIAAAPGNNEIRNNYEKMKLGQPTWPKID